MTRVTSMARAALLTALLLCIETAAADERTQVIDGIMAKATLECSTEAFQLALQGTDNKSAELIMGDVQRELKLTEEWEAPNPDYDMAYAVLLAAAAAEARRSGPLIPETSAKAFLRSIMATMPVATLRRFSDFFTAPGGSWNVPYLIDAYACPEIQNLISYRGAERATFDMPFRRMSAARAAQTRDWQTKVPPTPAEEAGATAPVALFIEEIVKGVDARLKSPARAARSAAIRRAHQAELNDLARAYMR